MAIAQTGSATQFNITTADSGTVSSTITVPSDAQIVVVGISAYDGVANYFSAGSMTFTKASTDTAMTSASTLGDTSNAAFMAAMFYMLAPDTGSNKSLKWDWLGATTADAAPLVSVTFWTGIDTASPVRSASGGQNGSGMPYTTGTLTAQTGDLIVAWAASSVSAEATFNTWSNLSTLAQATKFGSCDGAWATGSPSGNTTVAASTGTNTTDGGIVAIVLKPGAAAAAGGTSHKSSMLVMGRMMGNS